MRKGQKMLEDILREGFSSLSFPVSEQAAERFRIYFEYLEEMNKVMNLTAISGEEDVARLHFLDSLALLDMADFSGRSVIDVGTGAGFPGLALKIACPDIRLTLLDSLDKRIGFLRTLCEKLGFDDVQCLHARAEEAPPALRGSYDIAVSRAVARLNLLSELCVPFVRKGGLFIAMKGPGWEEEMKEAKHACGLLGVSGPKQVAYSIPGTDTAHCALIYTKTSATPAKYPRRWAQIKKSPL